MNRDIIRHLSEYQRAVARRNAARAFAIGTLETIAAICGAVGIVAIVALIALI